MKKIYFSMIALAVGFSASAQNLPAQLQLSKNNPTVALEQPTTPGSVAATGDTIPGLVYDMSTPANWTLTNTSSPAQDWEFVSAIPTNLVDLGYDAAMNSATDDMYAIVNGDGGGQGSSQACIMQLANPVDLSGYGAVGLSWSQYYRVFTGDEHYVEYSINGTDWTSIQVNGGASADPSDNVEFGNVVLAGAEGEATVWIRFRFVGAWGLFWTVDDVAFVEAPTNNLAVTEVFPGDVVNDFLYSKIPASQAVEVIAGAVSSNVGAAAQTNIVYTWDVSLDGTSMASGTENGPASLAVGEIDSVFISTGYTPTMGDVEITISVSADETDEALDNNEMVTGFEVTEYVWGHDYEDEDYFLLGYETGDDDAAGGFEFGADYFCQVDGDMIYALQFPLGNTTTSQSIIVKVYEDATTNGAVSETVYDIQPGDLSSGAVNFITVVLDDPVAMASGSVYTATVAIDAGEDGFILGNNIDDNDAGHSLYFVDTDTWFNWIGLTTAMRLNLDATIDVEENHDVSGVYVFPNPATDLINVGFVSKEDQDLTANIISVDGALVHTQSIVGKAGQSNTVRFNTENLSAGIYMVQLVGAKSTLTQRVVVQ